MILRIAWRKWPSSLNHKKKRGESTKRVYVPVHRLILHLTLLCTHTHTYILSLALSKLCRNKEQCNLMMVFCGNGVMKLWYCVPWILWKEMCKYGDLCFSSVGAAGQIEYESPLQVVLYPDPRLRAKNKIINVFDEKLQQLVQEMFDIMYKWVSLLPLSLKSDMSVNPRQDKSYSLLQLSWLSVIVWHFVNGSHKVMTALIVLLPLNCCCEDLSAISSIWGCCKFVLMVLFSMYG